MVSAGVPNMAMHNVNNLLNVKDSRWLQLEVCREFQRNKCTRPDTECKFAHPPPNVEVQNGRVTACYDSIKGRCNREKPPCKYFHPPQHLKDQLLINGRNHLALKNAIMTQIQGLSPGTAVVPGTIPVIQQQYYLSASSSHSRQESRPPPHHHHHHHHPPPPPTPSAVSQPQYNLYNTTTTTTTSAYSPESVPLMLAHNSPYLTGIPAMSNFNPYIASSPVMTMGVTDAAVASPITGVVPQQVVTAQKVPRTDRLEAFPGMGVPYKRPAGDKSGVPVYQPTGSAAYQQALMQQLGGQSFVPVSCEYGGSVPLAGVGGQADSQDTTAANNHAAASSAQPVPPSSSSSSITTTTNSSTTVKAICSTPVTASSSSSSSSLSLPGTGGDTASVSPVPLPPQPAVNVFSYTGYALSKSLRPQLKPPTSLAAPAVLGPTALSTSGFAHPMLPPGHIPTNFNYGVGNATHLPGIGISPVLPHGMTGAIGLPHGISSMTAGMTPAMGNVATANLGGIGSGVPIVTPSLVVPQIPTSMYLSPYTALSSNTHYSLAQGGEQPYKKLKTS